MRQSSAAPMPSGSTKHGAMWPAIRAPLPTCAR
uniref:Uncharacterized protein n=1 Tax=Macrostomum lignano TaxID=282301 RepID=A0A1I8FDL5_9PLAT